MKKLLAVVFAFALILGITMIARADDGTKNISVWYGVNLNVNGSYFVPTDVNGKIVPAFIYNGTTYVPIRAISELFGAQVRWDDSTKTAYIDYTDYEAVLAYYLGQQQGGVSVGTGESNTVVFPLHLYSNDRKTYLGKCVTDELDKDGIYYRLLGDYSWNLSKTSIWNTIGEYGSSYHDTSAFCDWAQHPPIITDNNGQFIAYLTTNTSLSPGWTISKLTLLLEENGQ